MAPFPKKIQPLLFFFFPSSPSHPPTPPFPNSTHNTLLKNIMNHARVESAPTQKTSIHKLRELAARKRLAPISKSKRLINKAKKYTFSLITLVLTIFFIKIIVTLDRIVDLFPSTLGPFFLIPSLAILFAGVVASHRGLLSKIIAIFLCLLFVSRLNVVSHCQAHRIFTNLEQIGYNFTDGKPRELSHDSSEEVCSGYVMTFGAIDPANPKRLEWPWLEADLNWYQRRKNCEGGAINNGKPIWGWLGGNTDIIYTGFDNIKDRPSFEGAIPFANYFALFGPVQTDMNILESTKCGFDAVANSSSCYCEEVGAATCLNADLTCSAEFQNGKSCPANDSCITAFTIKTFNILLQMTEISGYAMTIFRVFVGVVLLFAMFGQHNQPLVFTTFQYMDFEDITGGE